MPVIEKDLIKEVMREIQTATLAVLSNYKLSGTDLEKSIEWEYKDNSFILWANSYFEWVDKGRRPGVKRIPVEAIIKWMKKEGIRPYKSQTYNQAAFHITNAIYKVGIKGRNYKNKITEDSLELISELLAVELSVAIADEIAGELTTTI